MDWATIATIVGVILTTFTINRLFAGRRADKIDRRFDDLTKLLTDNLIEMKGELRSVQSQAHTHTHAQAPTGTGTNT